MQNKCYWPYVSNLPSNYFIFNFLIQRHHGKFGNILTDGWVTKTRLQSSYQTHKPDDKKTSFYETWSSTDSCQIHKSDSLNSHVRAVYEKYADTTPLKKSDKFSGRVVADHTQCSSAFSVLVLVLMKNILKQVCPLNMHPCVHVLFTHTLEFSSQWAKHR